MVLKTSLSVDIFVVFHNQYIHVLLLPAIWILRCTEVDM